MKPGLEDVPMADASWFKTSIVANRGLAKGQAGRRHELSVAAQGDLHYVYGPYAVPVLTIAPGDVVVVETEDAFGGVITSEQDSPTAKLQFPFLNPQCGPVAVSGVEKGDCLALYFPVHTKGGLLYVGDCHATQGDGELSGVAIEQRATVTLQIDVIKNWSFAWPRLETENFLMTIGSARPLEDAARIAYRELVRWMSADYGFDQIDAYMLLSQAGRIRLGNMVVQNTR
jgi:acetamidase/formamidase